MDDDQRLGRVLTRRILDLGRQIDEIEYVLSTWPSVDEEADFISALSAGVDRLRSALESVRAIVYGRWAADSLWPEGQEPKTEVEAPSSASPSEALAPVTTSSATSGPLAEPTRWERRPEPRSATGGAGSTSTSAGHHPRRTFRFPAGRDVEVTEAEWQEIQALLRSSKEESS